MNEPTKPFRGLKFLVVEDDTSVLHQVQDMLRALGAADVWFARKVAEAQKVLDDRRPDAAVLDINLAGEMVFPVAVELESAKVPFVFTTGYGRALIPPYWERSLTLQKPLQSGVLAAALQWVLTN